MTATLRRLLLAPLLVLAALAAAPAIVSAGCGQYSCAAPELAGVTPLQITLDGRPIHITLQGTGLSTVTAVIVAPSGTPLGWSVVNDQTVVVTLAAATAPGIYSVRVLSPQGGSDPSMAPQFEVFPAAPPSSPPTPTPKPTPTAKPTPTPTPPMPETGTVAAAVATPEPTQTPAPPTVAAGGAPMVAPTSASVDIMAGLAIGAMVYILWGNPRRLHGGWRREPLRNLVGRPAQALHVGRICLYCGRMHFILLTRRDLWRAGKYCRARCFISAEATATPLEDEEPHGHVHPQRATT